MVVLSAATFLPLVQPPVVCKSSSPPQSVLKLTSCCSFAFVEYESRRDADDAYHEMHNKRIGRDRDEVLKIEVCECFMQMKSPF